MISKSARTSNSTNYISYNHLGNELDRLLIKFGPSESTHNETKDVVDQHEFINFQILFQHNYYASNNKNFQHNYYGSNNNHFPA